MSRVFPEWGRGDEGCVVFFDRDHRMVLFGLESLRYRGAGVLRVVDRSELEEMSQMQQRSAHVCGLEEQPAPKGSLTRKKLSRP
jgi:hypothetical protein